MNAPDVRPEPDPARHGLCATCMHMREVRTARGSLFLLCQLHESDPRFTRYPPLPVRRCAGHQPQTRP